MTHLAAALVLALCVGQITADDPPRATLRGRVLDAQTGEPIAKALVSLPALGREVLTAGGRWGDASVPRSVTGDTKIAVSGTNPQGDYRFAPETAIFAGSARRAGATSAGRRGGPVCRVCPT